MNVYQINEARFVLPEGWHDQSINIFRVDGEVTGEFSFVIGREAVTGAELLGEFAGRHLDEIERSFSRFELLRREDTVLDGRPAVLAEFTWESEFGPMHQQQMFVFVDMVALTLTGTARSQDWEKHAVTLQRLLVTFQFGR